MTPEDEGVTAEDEAVTPAFKRYLSFKLFYKRSALGLRLRLEETSHRLLSREVEGQCHYPRCQITCRHRAGTLLKPEVSACDLALVKVQLVALARTYL